MLRRSLPSATIWPTLRSQERRLELGRICGGNFATRGAHHRAEAIRRGSRSGQLSARRRLATHKSLNLLE